MALPTRPSYVTTPVSSSLVLIFLRFFLTVSQRPMRSASASLKLFDRRPSNLILGGGLSTSVYSVRVSPVESTVKECNASKARGETDTTNTFGSPALNDFFVAAVDDTTTSAANIETEADAIQALKTQAAIKTAGEAGTTGTNPSTSCFTSKGGLRSIYAVAKVDDKFPSFKVNPSGTKSCRTGTGATAGSTYENTWDIGCNSVIGKVTTPTDASLGEWR